jgi:hypothetical protein
MFVKPGRHNYIVADLRSITDPLLTSHSLKSEVRPEEVIPFERVLKQREGDVFHRHKTIFAQWPEETPTHYRQAIEHDIRLWKVTRLIKDPDDYKRASKIIVKNAKMLCDLFKYISGKSQFPAINMFDVSAFCADSRIIDAKFIASSADRAFIAANTVNPDSEVANRPLREIYKDATK